MRGPKEPPLLLDLPPTPGTVVTLVMGGSGVSFSLSESHVKHTHTHTPSLFVFGTLVLDH